MGNVFSLSPPRTSYLKITHSVEHVEIGRRERIEDSEGALTDIRTAARADQDGHAGRPRTGTFEIP
jgi:hypothetical protein